MVSPPGEWDDRTHQGQIHCRAASASSGNPARFGMVLDDLDLVFAEEADDASQGQNPNPFGQPASRNQARTLPNVSSAVLFDRNPIHFYSQCRIPMPLIMLQSCSILPCPQSDGAHSEYTECPLLGR